MSEDEFVERHGERVSASFDQRQRDRIRALIAEARRILRDAEAAQRDRGRTD